MSEIFSSQLCEITLGPIHSEIREPFCAILSLDGEMIASCAYEVGYLYKNIEANMVRHDWEGALPYCGRIDPECSAFTELALCLSFEKMAELEVSPRAQSIRMLVCELNRISSHMGYLARFAKALGAQTFVHYILRDREKILDLFELIAGARFSLGYFRLGGVATDITEGFLERVLDVCDLIRIRIKEYNDIFCFNHALLKRVVDLAPVSRELAEKLSITGPNARAAGISEDVRKSAPYSGYDKIDFVVPVGGGGAHGRMIVRLREITQSTEIIKQIVEAMPMGAYKRAGLLRKPPTSEGVVRVESARGALECKVISKKNGDPESIKFTTPSESCIQLLPHVMPGVWREDFSPALASFDLCISEIDK